MLLQHLLLCSILLTALAARTHRENPEVAIDSDSFYRLIDDVNENSIHSILHSLVPKYRHGVFSKDSKALEQVHSEDPPLATSLLKLAKRVVNTSSTEIIVGVTSFTTSTFVTESFTTETVTESFTTETVTRVPTQPTTRYTSTYTTSYTTEIPSVPPSVTTEIITLTTEVITLSTPASATAVQTVGNAVVFSSANGGLITVTPYTTTYTTTLTSTSTLSTSTSAVVRSGILSNNGFSPCLNNGIVTVNNLNVQLNRSTNLLTFNLSGSSSKQHTINVSLVVAVYGTQVFNKAFDPCAAHTKVDKVDQLCPVPQGSFSATISQTILSEYVASYAYTVPDFDGNVKMTLTSTDSGEDAACIQTLIENGKSARAPAITCVAAGIAAAALGLSFFRALSAAGHPEAPRYPRASKRSPSFGEVIGWFQSMAMNGMYSVQYPSVYRSFTQNFAFSTGIIPWANMQMSIDSFRKATGGNLTDNSYPYIKNSLIVFSPKNMTANIEKRNLVLSDKTALDGINTSANKTVSGSSFSNSSKTLHIVQGIQGYVEQLSVSQANVFMTVLVIFAIVVAAIIVGILLFKIILEIWVLIDSCPKKLNTFRNDYRRIIYQTIIKLILLVYGIWTLYSIFQFTHGDSWAAKLLAGITLGVFTIILVFYCWKIWSVWRKFRNLGYDDALFDDEEIWKKYKLFYDEYKRYYWWQFIPAIIYMFVKGCVLAAGDGHGLVQTVGHLTIESLMLILLLCSRPYIFKSGTWVNIAIQVVRVISVACTLVFVEQFGVTPTPKTIVGLILIGIQSFLTCILAILIAINFLIFCCRKNPHGKNHSDNLTRSDNYGLPPTDPQQYKTFWQQHQRELSGAPLINPDRR